MTNHSSAAKSDPHEQHFRIPGPREGLSLFLRFLPATDTKSSTRRAVLYVHGGTCPSALSIAHRFDGTSWRDALNAAGFDVWGLTRDNDARWLFDALTGAPVKRDVKIGRGTHLMHLEAVRFAVWRTSIDFLTGEDVAPVL
jgi:hypothetical protein